MNPFADTRDACREGLRDVFDFIATQRADYEVASSEEEYENALQSARLVQQYEQMIAPDAPLRARDAFMAENTIWLLDQAGPDARMMLWAHNGHVRRVAGAQGDSLASAYGDSYVNLGFLFGTGSFNAFGDPGLQSWRAEEVPDPSLEAAFLRTGEPRLLFDTRQIPQADTAALPLNGPIPMRSIGAVFDPAQEANYFIPHAFPRHFDLLMYVEETTPSVLLPFSY